MLGTQAGGVGTDVFYDLAVDGNKHLYTLGTCQYQAQFGKTVLNIMPWNMNHFCLGKLKIAP